jgi:S-methylmethionine-dependent homocysteine/selenocysteine methylase
MLPMTQRITLLDGGMGRELMRMGAPFRQPEWSALALLEATEYVVRAHEAFARAGAEVLTTNSYAVVPFHLGAERFRNEGLRLAGLAGRLARQAAGPGARVAGSLPPVFGSYRPDLFDPTQVQTILQVLIAGLSPHVDQWQAETLSSIAEARAVRAALADDPRPLGVSFTLEDETVDTVAPRLRSGETVAEAARALHECQAAAMLFNCSQPEVMGAAIDVARDTLRELGSAMRLGVYANAFPPQPKTATANAGLDEIRADLTPEGYLAFARDWVELGASIIGGCCGIGPEHIATLRKGLR